MQIWVAETRSVYTSQLAFMLTTIWTVTGRRLLFFKHERKEESTELSVLVPFVQDISVHTAAGGDLTHAVRLAGA